VNVRCYISVFVALPRGTPKITTSKPRSFTEAPTYKKVRPPAIRDRWPATVTSVAGDTAAVLARGATSADPDFEQTGTEPITSCAGRPAGHR
jgi:hypothetical protein